MLKKNMVNEVNAKTLFEASHGTMDQVVPLQFAQASYKALEAVSGITVHFQKVEGLEHSMDMESLPKIISVVEDVIQKKY